jgi:preprotein translocase subunit SecG
MDLEIVETLVLVVHVLAALSIIGLVLLQHGKGADMGSGFGGGASSTVFGSGGAGNFLSRTTTTIAIAFFLTSFGLAFFAKEKSTAARDIGIPEVIQQVPIQAELPDLQIQTESEVPNLEASDSEIPEN